MHHGSAIRMGSMRCLNIAGLHDLFRGSFSPATYGIQTSMYQLLNLEVPHDSAGFLSIVS